MAQVQKPWGEVVEEGSNTRRGIVTSPAEIEKAHRQRPRIWEEGPDDREFFAEADSIVRELRRGLAQDRLMAAHAEEIRAERDRRSAEVQQALQAEFEASEREGADVSEGSEKPIEEPKRRDAAPRKKGDR
jgi:hypothetical protein